MSDTFYNNDLVYGDRSESTQSYLPSPAVVSKGVEVEEVSLH
jgi:hypothetical protein